MNRKNISSGSSWEPIVGYSRAVKVGDMVFVSGTTGVGQNRKVEGDTYAQAKRALEIIGEALGKADASMRNVVRTRIFLKNARDWEMAARAHREFFGETRPSCTMVEVGGFIAPEMLVEIEADAVIDREK